MKSTRTRRDLRRATVREPDWHEDDGDPWYANEAQWREDDVADSYDEEAE